MLATLPVSRRPLALAISLALGAVGADAATITVTAGGDGDAPACTLRRAIATMIAGDTDGTNCLNSGDAFANNDAIVFDGSLTAATITLNHARLDVSGLAAPLTIQGS